MQLFILGGFGASSACTVCKPMEFLPSRAMVRIRGPIPPTEAHKHHALQLTVATQGAVVLDGTPCASVLLREDTPHSLSADDSLTLLIEPESHCAQALRTRYLATSPICRDLPVQASAETNAKGLLAQLVPQLCLERHIDPRIADTLAWFDELQAEHRWNEVSLADALRRAALSESRFLHVFREQTGITWRAALIWRRAQIAMRLALAGSTLTEAAHRAGYSDSAHLSRQFKQLFGLTPSLVVQNSRIIQGGSVFND